MAKKNLFLIFLFHIIITTNTNCETYYLNYKPPFAPINIDFNIGVNGIEVKSIKFGSEQLITPIGAFKLVNKFYKSPQNTSVIFRNPATGEEDIFIIPRTGEIEVFANTDIEFKKDESIYKIYLVDENNKQVVIESQKLFGENVRIVIDPNSDDSEQRFGLYLTTSLGVKSERIEFYTLGIKTDVIPIKQLKEIRINIDEPFNSETLQLITRDGKVYDKYTTASISFDKYQFEDYFSNFISIHKSNIDLRHTTTYIGWFWIIGIASAIGLFLYLLKIGKIKV